MCGECDSGTIQGLFSVSAEYQIEVIESFSALQQALHHLTTALSAEEDYPCLMFDVAAHTPAAHKQTLITALNQLEYTDDQAPREIKVYPGLVGASLETLELAHQLNQCKLAFKQAVLNLKREKISLQAPLLHEYFSKTLYQRSASTSTSLKRAGMARLHLKQCYRLLPILDKEPYKISWTWANTRSIKKITVKQADELLQKRGDDSGIQQQRLKLSHLKADEPIAIVQELAPHLRANILFSTKEDETERRMIKGPMPIFFPADAQTVLPQIKPPKAKAGKNNERVLRADVKINPEPFLPAIRGFRYL